MSLRARVPKPETSRPRILRLLAILTDNPLEAWTAEHFEKPLVHDRLPFMPAVVVSDPLAVQRILLDNAQNYRKDKLLHRILSPTLSDGLLLVDGEQWRGLSSHNSMSAPTTFWTSFSMRMIPKRAKG